MGFLFQKGRVEHYSTAVFNSNVSTLRSITVGSPEFLVTVVYTGTQYNNMLLYKYSAVQYATSTAVRTRTVDSCQSLAWRACAAAARHTHSSSAASLVRMIRKKHFYKKSALIVRTSRIFSEIMSSSVCHTCSSSSNWSSSPSLPRRWPRRAWSVAGSLQQSCLAGGAEPVPAVIPPLFVRDAAQQNRSSEYLPHT